MPGDFVTIERFEEEIRKLKGKIKAKYNSGSVDFSKIIWLATPVDKAGLTTDDAWHDLDLTGDTSANAVGVVIWAKVSRGGGGASRYIYTRKDGSSAASGEGGIESNSSAEAGTFVNAGQWIQGCTTGQVIEYKVQTDSTVTFFYIVGYWE